MDTIKVCGVYIRVSHRGESVEDGEDSADWGTMILFELQCAAEHRFEAWFRNGATYEAQAAAGEVMCPLCSDSRVRKAPMAPRIARRRHDLRHDPALLDTQATVTPEPTRPEIATSASTLTQATDTELAQKRAALRYLTELRRKVEEKCDYVGDRFAEEARRIHYGEIDPRAIYGEASATEAAELQDEGVEFARIPWMPRTNS